MLFRLKIYSKEMKKVWSTVQLKKFNTELLHDAKLLLLVFTAQDVMGKLLSREVCRIK